MYKRERANGGGEEREEKRKGEKGEEEQEKVEKGREKGGGGRRDQVLRSSCKILQLYLFPLLRPPHCDSLRCTRGEERARYCHHEGPA